MPTISTHTSDELKRKIDRITREEGCKQAQVGSTALKLYAALPERDLTEDEIAKLAVWMADRDDAPGA